MASFHVSEDDNVGLELYVTTNTRGCGTYASGIVQIRISVHSNIWTDSPPGGRSKLKFTVPCQLRNTSFDDFLSV